MPKLKIRILVSDPQIAGGAAIKDMSLYFESRLIILHSEPFFLSRHNQSSTVLHNEVH